MSIDSKLGWSSRKNKEIDPVIFSRVHYPDLSRGQLQETDKPLYELMRRHCLLDHIAVCLPYGKDPLQFYHISYDGLTRGQLQSENKAYYEYLRRHDLLSDIPTK